MSRLNLPVFTQLLAPEKIAPAKDFEQTQNLYFENVPSLHLRHQIRFVLGKNIRFNMAEEDQVEQLIRHWRAKLSPELEENNTELINLDDDEQLKDLASEAPIIRLVNHLFARALDLNASDIHFEPDEHHLTVRCRVDGIMLTIETLPATAQAAISSRLKLMARLDIGEKRLPQDGRIQFTINQRKLDMRVSTLPGVYGESIVLRILDRSDVMVNLEQLGIPEDVLHPYTQVVSQPHGMVLITGPTGSGKTTTLYATLEKIQTGKEKIITVEDPVEYQLPGITQIHVNTKIGLDFASGLRSIVRQDPDIIMIGEIRDHETASIAIESALTGHLVFSTLHTNDAAGAISRLQDMGVEGYLISSSLLAVQAQRLVRKICLHCREQVALTEDEKSVLKLTTAEFPYIYRGKGCERCGGTGYRGRLGLYELLLMTESIRHLIASGADATKIRQQAIKEGLRTLRKDALEKLSQGITTPEEVVRVTHES